jgi:hypothetical protein
MTRYEVRALRVVFCAFVQFACESGSSEEGPRDAAASAHDLRMQARAYASTDVACTTDADCCVVIDYCTNEGYIVGVADRTTVRPLLMTP